MGRKGRQISRGAQFGSAALFLALLFTAPTRSQPGYNLTYQWTPGLVLNYSVYVVGQVQKSREPRQDLMLQYVDNWQVLSEDKPRHLYKTVEKSQNFSGAETNLRSFGLLARGEQVERMVDSHGRVATVTNYPPGHRFYLLPLVMSQTAVPIGGKWSLNQDLGVPLFEQEVTAKASIVYTFEGIAYHYKARDQDCALIRVEANYLYQAGDRNRGVSGDFQGKVFFDLGARKLVDFQVTEERREWVRSTNQSRATTVQVTAINQP